MSAENIDDLLKLSSADLLKKIRSESSGSFEDEKQAKRALYENILSVLLHREASKLNDRMLFLNVILVILTLVLVVLTFALLPDSIKNGLTDFMMEKVSS